MVAVAVSSVGAAVASADTGEASGVGVGVNAAGASSVGMMVAFARTGIASGVGAAVGAVGASFVQEVSITKISVSTKQSADFESFFIFGTSSKDHRNIIPETSFFGKMQVVLTSYPHPRHSQRQEMLVSAAEGGEGFLVKLDDGGEGAGQVALDFVLHIREAALDGAVAQG